MAKVRNLKTKKKLHRPNSGESSTSTTRCSSRPKLVTETVGHEMETKRTSSSLLRIRSTILTTVVIAILAVLCQQKYEHRFQSHPFLVEPLKELSSLSSSLFGWGWEWVSSKILIESSSERKKVQSKDENENGEGIVDNNDDDRLNSFLHWFRVNGGRFDTAGVSIGWFQEYGGYGVQWSPPSLEPQGKQNGTSANTINTIGVSSCNSSGGGGGGGIREMQALYTVPSALITSVESVIRKYGGSQSQSQNHVPPPSLSPQSLEASSSSSSSSEFRSRLERFLRKHSLSINDNENNNNDENVNGMLGQDVILALELMVQCALGSQSFFQPYLNVLPTTVVPRLDTFSEVELGMLQDEALANLGRRSRVFLERLWRDREFHDLVNLMIHLSLGVMTTIDHGGAPVPSMSWSRCTSFVSFHRFVSIVSSRAMVLRGRKFLTPFADMTNHHYRHGHRHRYRSSLSSSFFQRVVHYPPEPFTKYHHRRDDGSITVRADRDVGPAPRCGEEGIDSDSDGNRNSDNQYYQVLEDYGDVDNSLFLEAHGFVPENNPFHCAAIAPKSFVSSFHSLSRDIRDVLSTLKLVSVAPNGKEYNDDQTSEAEAEPEPEPILPDVCVRADGSFPNHGSAAEAFVAVLGLDPRYQGEDETYSHSYHNNYDLSLPSSLGACIKALGGGDGVGVGVGVGDFEHTTMACLRYPGHQTQTRRVIREAASVTYANLPTSLEEDTQLLASLTNVTTNVTPQQKIAVKFRIEEKKVLLRLMNLEINNNNNFEDEKKGEHLTTTTDPSKRMMREAKNPEELQSAVDEFNRFLREDVNIPLRHVEAKVVGDDLRLGAVATKDLDAEEVYLSVPIEWTIGVDNHNDNDSGRLVALLNKYRNKNDDMAFLIVYLLHETFVMGKQSRFWPYLNLLPSLGDMEERLLLFLDDEDDLDAMLSGSDLRLSVRSYRRRVRETYEYLVSDADVVDLLSHSSSSSLPLFSKPIMTYDAVRWAHAIVDTRSIWWNGHRHLVPLLDLVNCASSLSLFSSQSKGQSRGRVHATALDKTGRYAVTRTPGPMRRYEPILEDYGQPNHVYFLYHGFLLHNNHQYDCAPVTLTNPIQSLGYGAWVDRQDHHQQRHRRWRSPPLTFCVGGLDGLDDDNNNNNNERWLESVMDQVRMRYRRANDGTVLSDDDIVDGVRRVLQTRLRRHRDTTENADDGTGTDPRRRNAKLFLREERGHLERALARLDQRRLS